MEECNKFTPYPTGVATGPHYLIPQSDLKDRELIVYADHGDCDANFRAEHSWPMYVHPISIIHIRNVIAATPQSAARVFGWSLADTRQAAEALAKEGRLSLDVKVSGIAELQMVTHLM